jgi:hypothetical protein
MLWQCMCGMCVRAYVHSMSTLGGGGGRRLCIVEAAAYAGCHHVVVGQQQKLLAAGVAFVVVVLWLGAGCIAVLCAWQLHCMSTLRTAAVQAQPCVSTCATAGHLACLVTYSLLCVSQFRRPAAHAVKHTPMPCRISCSQHNSRQTGC